MNIQYYHKRSYAYTQVVEDGPNYDVVSPRGGETIALEVAPAWLLETLKPGDFFEKKVGKAKCSNEDNYNKKTGRELATSRMKATRLTCTNNNSFGEVRFVTIEDQEGKEYTIRLYQNSKLAHFIEYE